MLRWAVNSKLRHRIVGPDNAQPRDPLVRPVARAVLSHAMCAWQHLSTTIDRHSRRCATAKRHLKMPLVAAVRLKLRLWRRCRVLSHIKETSLEKNKGHALRTSRIAGKQSKWSPRIWGRPTAGLLCSSHLKKPR